MEGFLQLLSGASLLQLTPSAGLLSGLLRERSTTLSLSLRGGL